jgi:hypothetical protein
MVERGARITAQNNGGFTPVRDTTVALLKSLMAGQ